MSKSKRFCIGVVSALLAALLLCAGTVFVVDPLQVYRQATWYTPLIDYVTQVYTNAGIAKHYSYDSAIVGTSLTENSAPSLYDELFGGEWIKLVTSGGTAHNHAILMDVAFRTREMKRIVYGLDIYSFIAEKDETAQDVPMYLYDDNPFNDVYYLLNKDILFDRLYETYQYNAEGLTYLTRDSMYYWGGNYEFSEAEVLKGVNPTAGAPDQWDISIYDRQMNDNLEYNLLPFIEQHPETEFLIYFPPYSVMEYVLMRQKGHLDFVLNMKDLITERLLPYENVKLYDFQTRADWVLDLNNYKDTTHHSPEINDAIAYALAADEGRVNDIYDVYEHDEQIYDWVDIVSEGGQP